MPYLENIDRFNIFGKFPDFTASCPVPTEKPSSSSFRKIRPTFKRIKTHKLVPNAVALQYSKLSEGERREFEQQLTIVKVDRGYILTFKKNSSSKALLNRQKRMRKGCWRIVHVEGSNYLAGVEQIRDTTLTVKILDSRVPVGSWKSLDVNPWQLSPTHITHAKTLSELICNLKRTRILHSAEIERALRTLDRQHFCSENPYFDCAINFGQEQYGACISSPHMHVWAAELLKDHLKSAAACLDVGSGSGYFTALMKILAPQARVYGIEYYSDLIATSEAILREHYPEILETITFVEGDGEAGLDATRASFQAIHVGFMCQKIPGALLAQLALGGRMLIPIASGKLSTFDNRCQAGVYTCVDKDLHGNETVTPLFSCSFVPSTSKGKRELC